MGSIAPPPQKKKLIIEPICINNTHSQQHASIFRVFFDWVILTYMSRFSPNITVMVAVAVPDIGPLVSLVGSVGFSLLGLVVPVIMETVWYWSEEDEDNGQEQDCLEGNTVTTSETTVTDVGTTAAVDGRPATTVAVAADGSERRPSSRGRGCRRAIRHLKNLILLLLSLLALVGGAFYNIRDIMAGAFGDGSPAPTI